MAYPIWFVLFKLVEGYTQQIEYRGLNMNF